MKETGTAAQLIILGAEVIRLAATTNGSIVSALTNDNSCRKLGTFN